MRWVAKEAARGGLLLIMMVKLSIHLLIYWQKETGRIGGRQIGE